MPHAELGLRLGRVAGDAALSDRYFADRRISARTAAIYRAAHSAFVAACGSPYDARCALHGVTFVRELSRTSNTLPLSRATLAGFSKVKDNPLHQFIRRVVGKCWLRSANCSAYSNRLKVCVRWRNQWRCYVLLRAGAICLALEVSVVTEPQRVVQPEVCVRSA